MFPQGSLRMKLDLARPAGSSGRRAELQQRRDQIGSRSVAVTVM